jgi:hypothetical protein
VSLTKNASWEPLSDTSVTTHSSVTHKIFGVPQTINTANYVYFQAYQELFKFRRRNRDGVTRNGQDSASTQESEIYLDEVITGKHIFRLV